MSEVKTISPQEHAVSILRAYVDHFDNPEKPMVLPRGVLEDVVRRVDALQSSHKDLVEALEGLMSRLDDHFGGNPDNDWKEQADARKALKAARS